MSAVLGRNGKPMRLVAAVNTTPVADTKAKPVRVCKCGNDVIGIAEFMVTEMKRNPFSEQGWKMSVANAYDAAKEMKSWDALPWYGKIGGPPNFTGIAAGHKAAAYTIWTERVAPKRPWDHKPILSARLKTQQIFHKGWQRYGNEDYYYDIWSNIHFGYVGAACGFGLDELLDGAGLAQAGFDFLKDGAVQDHPENGGWPQKYDDIPDHIAIKLGFDLYKQTKPASLTLEVLLKAIVGVPIPWGSEENSAKRLHECPT